MQISLLNKTYHEIKPLALTAAIFAEIRPLAQTQKISNPLRFFFKSKSKIFTEQLPANVEFAPSQVKNSLKKIKKKDMIAFLEKFPLKTVSETDGLALLDIFRIVGKKINQSRNFTKDLWENIPQEYAKKHREAATIMHQLKPQNLKKFEPQQLVDLYERTSINLTPQEFCNLTKNCDPEKLKFLQENNFGNMPKEIFEKFNELHITELINDVKLKNIQSVSPQNWQKILEKQDAIDGNGIIHYLKTGKKEFLLEKAPKIEFEDIKVMGVKLQYKVANSNKLPLNNLPKKGIEVSNFEPPKGSVGIKTNPSETIYTSDIFQCAGLAIYDAKGEQQSLSHIFNCTSPYDIKKGLLRLFPEESFKEGNRLKIEIVNGSYQESEKTINRLLETIHSINPEAAKNIKFKHFPNECPHMLGMHNGELFATKQTKKFAKECILETNPKNRIETFGYCD